MQLEQLYTGCLAEAAYFIESNGEVAIIDPLREVDAYIEKARAAGGNIKYIFETHFHADFVSGHVELAEKTGATIIYGPGATPTFGAHIAVDNEVFTLGNVTLQVLHTPGHTMESACYLLKDEAGKDYCLFTGDTLFIGDVGRPDLAQGGDMRAEDMAGMLYDSLQRHVMPLADDVIIYPAHGAGSACGKNMSKETYDTLGHQKQYNYALQAADRDDFISKVTEGLMPPPGYFASNVALNKGGYKRLESVYESGLRMLSVAALEQEVAAGALVLDTRNPEVFSKGFIPGAINIGLNGQFAPWVGVVIKDINTPIILVTEPGKEQESVTRLARVGYDNAIGYLAGGIEAWTAAGRQTDRVERMQAEVLAALHERGDDIHVIDVRKAGEYNTGHLPFAEHKPLDYIYEWEAEMEPETVHYIHCAGGYRSMIAASVLKAAGVRDVIDIEGGFSEIKKTGLPVEVG